MVNACRLYLNVTMLSEIMDANGEYMQQWAMHGTQQNETAMDYPYQPKPPPRAWKTWRDALHATYLDINRTADSCPLHKITTIHMLRRFDQSLPDYTHVKMVQKIDAFTCGSKRRRSCILHTKGGGHGLGTCWYPRRSVDPLLLNSN